MSAQATDGDTEFWRQKFRQFYSVHNPAKLQDVERLLQKHKGKEASVFAILHKKYPTAAGDMDAPIVRTATTESALV